MGRSGSGMLRNRGSIEMVDGRMATVHQEKRPTAREAPADPGLENREKLSRVHEKSAKERPVHGL